jgi:hypothetical protein
MAPSISKNPMEIMRKENMIFKKFDIKKIKIEKNKQTLKKWM